MSRKYITLMISIIICILVGGVVIYYFSNPSENISNNSGTHVNNNNNNETNNNQAENNTTKLPTVGNDTVITTKSETSIRIINEYDEKLFTANKNLLIMFASWCPNCQEEINEIEKILKHYKNDKNVNIVLIAHEYEETLEDLINLVENDVNFGNVEIKLDLGRIIRKTIDPQASTIPISYVVDKDGKVLEMHKAPITQGKGDDKRWSTYVPDETAKSKRRLIRKATEEQVINELVKFYAHVEKQTSTKRKRFPKDITVKEFYPKWVEYKMQNPKLSTETIKRYKSDYTRCIEYSEFGQLRLCDVDEIDIEEFLVAEIERLNLKKRAVSNLKGYLNQMFKYARRSRIIESNPCDLVDCQDLNR